MAPREILDARAGCLANPRPYQTSLAGLAVQGAGDGRIPASGGVVRVVVEATTARDHHCRRRNA